MGSCGGADRRSHERRERDRVENDPIPTLKEGKSLPLNKNVDFNSEPRALTLAELEEQREVYWDTAPKYDGRSEIWQALKAACEEPELEMAQIILDTVGIIIPTGFLSDGVFDEMGNRYVIPPFCFAEPRNLIRAQSLESSPSTSPVEDGSFHPLLASVTKHRTVSSTPSAFGSTVATNLALDITLRLSTSRDINLQLYQSTTVKEIKEHVAAEYPGKTLRFFYMGRMFEDDRILRDIVKHKPAILQVMIS